MATGQEGLASDYKLLKHPVGQLLLGFKVIFAEFGNHADALEAYLKLNGITVEHENSPSV